MIPIVTDIVHEVLPHFGLEAEGIDAALSRDRHWSHAAARHVAMWLVRQKTTLSFPEIGREFGNRDHTTVMSGIRRVERALREDPDGPMASTARLLAVTIPAVQRREVERPSGVRNVALDASRDDVPELDLSELEIGAAE